MSDTKSNAAAQQQERRDALRVAGEDLRRTIGADRLSPQWTPNDVLRGDARFRHLAPAVAVKL